MRIITILNIIFAALPVVAGSGPGAIVDQWWSAVHTMSEARSLQTAVEAYAQDHQRYPAAKDLKELEKAVGDIYIRTMPTHDGWGNLFLYRVSNDGRSYVIASAGSDGQFDESTWSAPGFSTSSKDDMVLKSGDFTKEWVVQRVCK